MGIGVNLLTRRSAIDLLQVARDAGWKVVLGGPEPSSYAEEYLACGADVIVQGEAEVTMEELLPALQARRGIWRDSRDHLSRPGWHRRAQRHSGR